MTEKPLANSTPSNTAHTDDLQKAAQAELVGTTKFMFFDETDSIICSSSEVGLSF